MANSLLTSAIINPYRFEALNKEVGREFQKRLHQIKLVTSVIPEPSLPQISCAYFIPFSSNFLNPASSMIVIPNSVALSNFDPAESPATT